MASSNWPWPEIFSLSVCSFLFFLLFTYLHQRKLRPWCPVDWPLVGMLPGLLVNFHNFHHWVTGILTSSGGSFLFYGPGLSGMKIVATADPANVQHVFTSFFPNYPKGEEFAEIFDILGDGIFNADGESWRRQRSMAQKLMARPQFQAYLKESSRQKVEDGFLPFLGRAAKAETLVDLQDVFMRLAFDTTTKLVFGVDPVSLSDQLPTIPFAKAMDDVLGTLFFRHTVPVSLWKLLRRLKIGKEREIAEARTAIDEFIGKMIAQRREEKLVQGDLLSSYIDGGDHGAGVLRNGERAEIDVFLRDTTLNFMLAGRDTVGTALSWFFYALCKNPRVEQRLLKELSCFAQKKGSRRDDMVVFNQEDIDKIVYLHAAINECLRLYPPVPFEHKGVINSDVLPSGFEVDHRWKILVFLYSMGRMESVWGEDAMEFRPERWISEKGKLRYEPSYKFMAFNSGPRTCLGREMAFVQMKVAIAGMLWNFQVDMVDGHAVEPKLSVILHMKNGMIVRVKRRPPP